MKKMLKQTLVAASLALLAGGASAQITNTPHNLTSATQPNSTTGTDQICVFCHTPHASNTDATAPLWNKALPAATAYTTYSTATSSTIDGGVLDVGSVSAACLSCHDGTQAMDNMVNAPGSGGWTAAGADQGYTWTGNAAGTGRIAATRVANLSQDLTNDHPIGIQYCGGGLTATLTDKANCNDLDFNSVQTKDISGSQVFWVDTTADGAAAVRGKKDIILYTRDFTSVGGAIDTPSVECASCHDPHTQSQSTDEVNFMRVTTAGSQICLACHTK